MTYAFLFDASACSGCKACQAACKDKNNLPLGVLWRRNYEVGGGEWMHTGDAWSSTVFAYYLSIACNHCVHPKCAGVCPVNAYSVRDDGIVLLDSSKCIGCGYCAWACPYGAPQYDRMSGTMSKCNLCYDNLDTGLPPACVAACPMRVLDVADQSDLEESGLQSQVVFPMPVTSRTEPRVFVKPHPAAGQSPQSPQVLNQEEIAPQRKHLPAWAAWEEIPLLGFTLLGQMAAGISWILGSFVLTGVSFSLFLHLAIGAILSLGLLISFLHLGTPGNAWRVFGNLPKSWLSREILAAMVFSALWAITTIPYLFSNSLAMAKPLLAGITGLAGAVLVFSMAEVYRLRMVPAWNTWRTKAAFFLSALILGGFSVGTGSVLTGMLSVELTPLLRWIGLIAVPVLGLELALTILEKWRIISVLSKIRLFVITLGIAGAALLAFGPVKVEAWSVCLVFLIVIFEEVIGRWLFYSSRNPSM